MEKKITTHRVVTFLTREELDFLDKLEKDAMFSGGHISRSKILEDMADILTHTKMDAVGIKDNEDFKRRVMEAIAGITKKEEGRA